MAGFRDRIYCVIPVYNNAATLRDIVSRCLEQLDHVLVVDDGSTDCDPAELLAGLPVRIHRHERNLGKGAALRTAIALLKDKPEIDYMITLDADGQHYPEDIPLFFPFMEANDYSMLIGCRDFSGEHVPGSSKFGRSFSNFWMKVETGIDVADCQSGFRAYPLRYISRLRFLSRHFDFEAEVLARAGWGNLEFHDVPIRSFYPPSAERISHFKPFPDNLRLTLIHTHLVMLRLLPFPKKKLRRKPMDFSIFRPKELFLYLLRENSSNGGLAASAAVGSFLAVLPIFGFHMAVILYVTARLHLNKLMALSIQNLFMPPLSPFLCIELGYYLRYGRFWTEINWNTLVNEFHLRAFEWLLGSLILAPFWGVVMGVAVYFTAKAFRAVFRKEGKMPEKKSLSDTRGNSLGILFFIGMLKLFGVNHACGMVWMVSFFYTAFDARARRSAMPYVRHRFPDAGFFRRFFHVWALFTSQGQAIVEQYAMHLGKLRLERDHFELYRKAETEYRAHMVAFSHFGPWQAMLSGVGISWKPVNIMMKPDRNRSVDKFSAVAKDPEESKIKVISVDDPMGGILEAVSVLEKGEAVGIMADRCVEEKGVPVMFLGEEAMFPTAGFFIAARCGCPVVCVFSHRKKKHEVFTAEFGPLIHPVMEGRRRETLRKYVQEYAARLEEMCMKYPYECYIFEDIWKK